ncbi:MAG: hypothetical protein JSU98_02555 [Gemmatimonadales bacterium]|jgi:spore germination protein YaaH|nr:MAG: hypothetical protein JSU98_02555 [Gemmatimonadales bacterium]
MAGCASSPPQPVVPEAGTFFLAGYHPYWAGDAWREYPSDHLRQLFFFELELAPDGSPGDLHGWPHEWDPLVAHHVSRGVQVVPTVTLHGSGAFAQLFSDPLAVDRAVEGLLDLLRDSPEIRGLHLDVEVFEPVPREARDGYTAFAAGLRAGMQAMDPGLGLSIFTLAFDDADAYNERALAAIADFLVVQGYDLHDRTDTRAGPVAALRGWGRLNWETVVARYDALGIHRSRLVMGVPLYGYQWPTETELPGSPTRGEGVAAPLAAPVSVLPNSPRAWREAARHGTQRDPESGIPYYVFRDAGGGWVQGWFEDRQSLREKLEFVRAHGLAGVALFPLAYATADVWRDVEEFAATGRH